MKIHNKVAVPEGVASISGYTHAKFINVINKYKTYEFLSIHILVCVRARVCVGMFVCVNKVINMATIHNFATVTKTFIDSRSIPVDVLHKNVTTTSL